MTGFINHDDAASPYHKACEVEMELEAAEDSAVAEIIKALLLRESRLDMINDKEIFQEIGDGILYCYARHKSGDADALTFGLAVRQLIDDFIANESEWVAKREIEE